MYSGGCDKRFLGFVETDTESEKLLTPILHSLVGQGRDVSSGLLVVIDGAKGFDRLTHREGSSQALPATGS